MKFKPIKNTIQLFMAILMLYNIASCSEEIVLIEEKVRTELDSIETQILVVSNELEAAKIAKKALDRRLDSLKSVTAPSAQNRIQYTIQVTDGSGAYTNGRIASLANAIVTVSQGVSVQEVTTDGTGFATFPEMVTGYISVTVELTGYADVYMIVHLNDSGSGGSDIRYASTSVMVFPTEGDDMYTLSGTSYYNEDLDNLRTGAVSDPAHPFTGLDRYETVPIGTDFTIECIPIAVPNNTVGAGRIIDVVYAGLARVGTTDSNGNWSVSVPVVFLTNGSNLFNYTGPFIGDTFEGTQISVLGNTSEVWAPVLFYPDNLNEIIFFPGGNSIQDLYYFPL